MHAALLPAQLLGTAHQSGEATCVDESQLGQIQEDLPRTALDEFVQLLFQRRRGGKVELAAHPDDCLSIIASHDDIDVGSLPHCFSLTPQCRLHLDASPPECGLGEVSFGLA
jgi:hypothetical protein